LAARASLSKLEWIACYRKINPINILSFPPHPTSAVNVSRSLTYIWSIVLPYPWSFPTMLFDDVYGAGQHMFMSQALEHQWCKSTVNLNYKQDGHAPSFIMGRNNERERYHSHQNLGHDHGVSDALNIPSPPAGITNSNYHRHQTLRTQLSAFLFRETRHRPRSQVLSQQQGRPT